MTTTLEIQDDAPIDADTIESPETTPEDTIAAYRRKEQTLRDASAELNRLEDEQAALRKEVNGYKKPIAEARAKVDQLISCDIAGFLEWEKQKDASLFAKEDAWRELPVSVLDLPAKDKENVEEHFANCGSLADWLCLDFPPKKAGLNGEKVKERLRNAINKIAGVEEQYQEGLENEEPQPEPETEEDDGE